ncbi:MAG TPA: hypothetical protein VGI65_16165 [Steroidobacteraceae bacterium]|jgi:hypothetical protein
MESMTIPVLGTALMMVLIMLGERNMAVARFLCRIGLHVWSDRTVSARYRICVKCEKCQRARTSKPGPWDWD